MSQVLWFRLAECGPGTVEYDLSELLRLIGLSTLIMPPPRGLGFTIVAVQQWSAAKAIPAEHHEAIRKKLDEHRKLEGYDDDAGGTNNGQWDAYAADFANGEGLSIGAIARKYNVSRAAVQKGLAAKGVR